MGRPIQKRKIGNQPGRIAVTNVKWADGTAQADNENGVRVYISRQRSTRKFLVEASDGSKSEVCTLVGKSPSLVAGTFDIAVEVGDLEGASDGSTIYWVVKLKTEQSISKLTKILPLGSLASTLCRQSRTTSKI